MATFITVSATFITVDGYIYYGGKVTNRKKWGDGKIILSSNYIP